jgi:glyoxylase-like metal-dependent hydrolase (beta-lactamase superfamily II)
LTGTVARPIPGYGSIHWIEKKMSQDAGERSPPLPDSIDLSPGELARLLEGGEPIQIMDVRAPERVAQGRIDLVAPERFHNVRGSRLRQLLDVASTGLDPNLPVAVVCGQGSDSKVVAHHLERLGLDARSLAGGLVAWMRLTRTLELDPTPGLDRLVQFDRVGKGCLGYLLVSDGEAVIVDPPLHFDTYLEVLEETEAKLVGVADTHAHADYVSGAVWLAKRFGVPYYLHPADAVYPYDGTPGRIDIDGVSEGEGIRFGRTALRALHTPGHTEGSLTYVVEDRIALTGDFLFVASIGRPDLAGKEEEWARQLWDSVARAKERWDDELVVYPAHYGDQGERRMGRAVGIPFGILREENEILRIQDPESFVHHIVGRTSSFPEAYSKIKAINLGLAPVVETEVDELEVGRNECALGGDAGS